MNIFRSLTALLSFGSTLIPSESIGVDAAKERHLRSRFLQPPPEDVCDDFKEQRGPAYGLCNAYLKKDCDSEDIKSCDKIQEEWEDMGLGQFPFDTTTTTTTTCTEVIYTAHEPSEWNLGVIDPVSGDGSDVGPFDSGDTTASLAIDPAGVLYTLVRGRDVITNEEISRLATVDPSTGEATLVDSTITIPFMIALAVDPAGNMYGVGSTRTDTNLYQINKATGVATDIGDTGVSSMNDLAFDSSSGTLYGTDGDELYTINTGTGAIIENLGSVSGASGPIYLIGGIMFNGSVLYATTRSPGDLYTVNLGTMAASLVGNTGLSDVRGGAFGCA